MSSSSSGTSIFFNTLVSSSVTGYAMTFSVVFKGGEFDHWLGFLSGHVMI